MGRPRLRDHPALVAVTVGVAVAEAALVAALGIAGAGALAPQVTAPAPFGVFHDLRFLLVYHSSWLGFVVEAVVVLALRSVLDALIVRRAWPRTGPACPGWRDELGRVARFTVLEALVLLPFAVLVFGMGVVSLSWLFFVAVPVLVMAALLLHHGAVDRRWWRDAPARTSAGIVVVAFASLTVAGAMTVAAPGWMRVPIAAVAGVVNAWCWLRIVYALAGRAPAPSRRPFALVGLAAVFTLVVGGAAGGFAVAVEVEGARHALPRVSPSAMGPPVLVVKGFNSRWDGVTRRWIDGDYRIQRFSYRGVDACGEPRPYGRADTHRSVRDLARLMRDQVASFAAATGSKVSVVAESEGSLVAQTYLAATPDAPVRSLLLLSPLVEPGRVFYPRAGSEGWGVVAGAVLDGLSTALGGVGPVDVSADLPLFRSILDEAPPLRQLLHCPAPVAQSLAVLPLDSGVSAPAPIDFGVAHAVVPAFHGGLLGDDSTARLVEGVLRGRTVARSGFWQAAGDVVGAGAAAWQAPDLEPTLNPRWASLLGGGCGAVRQELRAWIGG